jgi:hypothetical protein
MTRILIALLIVSGCAERPDESVRELAVGDQWGEVQEHLTDRWASDAATMGYDVSTLQQPPKLECRTGYPVQDVRCCVSGYLPGSNRIYHCCARCAAQGGCTAAVCDNGAPDWGGW